MCGETIKRFIYYKKNFIRFYCEESESDGVASPLHDRPGHRDGARAIARNSAASPVWGKRCGWYTKASVGG